jgi:hypothetical protein
LNDVDEMCEKFTKSFLKIAQECIPIFSLTWYAKPIAWFKRAQYSESVHSGRYVLHKRKEWPLAWTSTQIVSSMSFSSSCFLQMPMSSWYDEAF